MCVSHTIILTADKNLFVALLKIMYVRVSIPETLPIEIMYNYIYRNYTPIPNFSH